MMPRTLLSLLVLAVLLPGCSPESTGPGPDDRGSEITAIHIARGGVPVDSLVRTGTLGSMTFELLLETRGGALHPVGEARVAWGSTHPAVADQAFTSFGQVFVLRHQNGRAKLVAEMSGLRDTVTLEIRQVPSKARLDVDTIVTLAPGARDITGAPTLYHTMRFGAVRVDSSGYLTASMATIAYEPVGDAPFEIFPTPRGDTISIAGTQARDGWMVIRFAGRADTVPVQVATTYRVVRLSETPTRTLRPLPPTLTIPRGTAIVFRNETSSVAEVGDWSRDSHRWQTSVMQPGGVEAQLFRTAGTYQVFWAGERCLITVTP